MRLSLQLLSILGLISAFWYLTISSTDGVVSVYYSGGATASAGDRTGSPISGGSTCASCHSGGSYNPSIGVVVRNSGGNPVTAYVPGAVYTIEYTMSNTAGSPAGYGMQSVALTSSNANAGNFSAFSTPNSKITTLSGRKYVEHQGVNGAGFFSFSWTAPSAGTGNVTLYSIGNAVNGTGGTSGDKPSTPITTVLTEVLPTTITYSSPNFCVNGSDPTPTISGTQGGTFTASPAGLVIDPNTGQIDVSASTVNTNYTITYTHANGSTTRNVRINQTYQTNNTATICANDSIFLAGAYRNTAGTYLSNFQSIYGCDSMVSTQLSIKPIYNFQDPTQEICQGDSVLVYGTYRKLAGQYTNNLTTVLGCDSIYQTQVVVRPVDSSLQALTICNGDSVLIFNTYKKNSGTYVLNTSNQYGCDSTSTVELTVRQPIRDTVDYSICVGDSILIFGNYQSTPGMYIDSAVSVQGCDSVTIAVLDTVVTNLNVTQNGLTLTAAQANALSYQWLDCDNNFQPIGGATQQSYTVPGNGSYAVDIELATCTKRTNCFIVFGGGLTDLQKSSMRIYPNPSKGNLYLEWDDQMQVTIIRLLTLAGKELNTYSPYAGTENFSIDTRVVPGVYLVEIHSNLGVELKRWVVE